MMKKWIIRIIVLAVLLIAAKEGRDYYGHYKQKQYRAPFFENLVDTSSPTITTFRDSISPDYRHELHTVYVYVPPSYDLDSTTRYPVIYLMDGDSAFDDLENESPEWQVDEIINAASENGEQSSIVVAVRSAEDRDAEYTPYINEDNPDAHGAEYTKWMATDFKSWVDSNYRTKTDALSTTIGGVSRSGMMAYYMFMTHSDIYGNALIQSPAMWVDHDRLLDMEITAEQMKEKKVFVSVGEYEGRLMISHAEDVYNKFKVLGMDENHLRYSLIEGEGHWSVTWRKSFAQAYPWMHGY